MPLKTRTSVIIAMQHSKPMADDWHINENIYARRNQNSNITASNAIDHFEHPVNFNNIQIQYMNLFDRTFAICATNIFRQNNTFVSIFCRTV